jgi:hypothetical protein
MKYAVLLAIGSGISWYFYHYKKRELFGRFLGGMIVALLGAIVFDLIFTLPFMKPIFKLLTESTYVHIPGAFLGAYLAVFILNKINHDQERRDL